MTYIVSRGDVVQDGDELLKFWKEHGDRPIDDKYRWMYLNNPYGKANIWFLKIEETGEVVGTAALFPRKLMLDGNVVLAGVAGDLLVNKEHRTLRPALSLVRQVRSALDDNLVEFIYIIPNKKAEMITKRAGYKCVGSLKRYVKIQKSQRQLEKRGVPRVISNIVAPMIDFWLVLRAGETWCRFGGKIRYEVLSQLDKRFDALWEECSSGCCIAPERTSEYIEWKFLNDPDDENIIYGAFSEDDTKMLGCIVYRRDASSIEIRELILTNNRAIRVQVVRQFLRYIKKFSVESVIVNALNNKKISTELVSYGFKERGDGRNVYLSMSKKLSKYSKKTLDADNWIMMLCDEDT